MKALEGAYLRVMGEEKRGPLADTPVPIVAPAVPEDVVDDVLAALSGRRGRLLRGLPTGSPWNGST